MSFLKDLKNDLTTAVNELVDDGAKAVGGKKESEQPAESVQAVKEATEKTEETVKELDLNAINEVMEEQVAEETAEVTETAEAAMEEVKEEVIEEVIENVIEEVAETVEIAATEKNTEVKEEVKMDIFEEKEEVVASDEVTEITAGTTIRGDIETNGSINVYGKIVGNIKCLGKISVTGTIVGTTEASEVFANNARIEGDIISEGCVKVGNGSVIIGAVAATSAVIGGAIKGDIDVHGPVIVDATAVVKGDIMSRSVQINNGAVIDGRCSQCYADIDYESLFDDAFSK